MAGDLVVLVGVVLVFAALFSILEVWAAPGGLPRLARTMLAGLITTAALAGSFILMMLGTRIAPAHVNVAWTAVLVSAPTSMIAFSVAIPRVLKMRAAAVPVTSRSLLTLNVPLLAALIVVDYVILVFRFIANIH